MEDQKKRADRIKKYVGYLGQIDERIEFLKNIDEKTDSKIKEVAEYSETLASALSFLKEKLVPLLPDDSFYEKFKPGTPCRLALHVVGTVVAVEYGGGETLNAVLGLTVGYLASQNSSLRDLAGLVADKVSSDEATRKHTYETLMDLFALTGALAGGPTGQAAYQLNQPEK